MPSLPHLFAQYRALPPLFSLQSVTSGVENQLGNLSLGEGAANEGISALFLGLSLIIAIPVVIFVSLKIVRFVRIRRQKELIEEMKQQAARHEKAGEFASAGLIYEKLKEPSKAAKLFELAGDFARAAAIYESLEEMKKAREMHEKAGDPGKAAELCMMTGDYLEAARIYRQSGDKLRTAQALEMTGNRLAAVRAYREANDYLKAAQLLSEEGMYKEAAEMYGISLSGEDMEKTNIGRFYAYASLLETAGEMEKACGIYKDIAAVDPDYRNASEKAGTLSTRVTEEEKEKEPETSSGEPEQESQEQGQRGIRLRSLISHRMEPRYSLRLWVQILKALDREVKKGVFPDSLTPEGIFIDSANEVAFSRDTSGNVSYRSPEAASVSPPDEASLIYSMGVILYEMLTGNLVTFGLKKPSEVRDDIPRWLDELTMKCTERERTARYQSFEEIFSTLLSLKSKT